MKIGLLMLVSTVTSFLNADLNSGKISRTQSKVDGSKWTVREGYTGRSNDTKVDGPRRWTVPKSQSRRS